MYRCLHIQSSSDGLQSWCYLSYVSSYAGPVKIDPNARLGYVARVDTTTLTVKDTCVVGYQPEEMVIVGNKLYVANSGGYRVPNSPFSSAKSVV